MMTTCEVESVAIDFGIGGNEHEFLLEGWSGAEQGFRWAIGRQSELRLPPLSGTSNFLMALVATPPPIAGQVTQVVDVYVNDSLVGRLQASGPSELATILRRDFFLSQKQNRILFRYARTAQPGELDPAETRRLSLCFRAFRLQRTDLAPLGTPKLLATLGPRPGRTAEYKELAESFESLGQNCEFGMWQRQCGAEPYGLLRFASARIHKVLRGIRTGFDGIADAGKLSIRCSRAGGEYMGHHSVYELDYHTFRNEGEVDLNSFAAREPPRLAYLARELMMQISSAGKVFVIQRGAPPLTLEEVLPLFIVLKTINRSASLLYVTASDEASPELHNRVEECSAGLFHGYLKKLAPAEHAYRCDFDGWLEICSTVAATRCQRQAG